MPWPFGALGGMPAMPAMPAMLELPDEPGSAEAERGGNGWPGGGIVSPPSAAYGPTCGAIDELADDCGVAADAAAAMPTAAGCGIGVLP
jgi:hypothetical protein